MEELFNLLKQNNIDGFMEKVDDSNIKGIYKKIEDEISKTCDYTLTYYVNIISVYIELNEEKCFLFFQSKGYFNFQKNRNTNVTEDILNILLTKCNIDKHVNFIKRKINLQKIKEQYIRLDEQININLKSLKDKFNITSICECVVIYLEFCYSNFFLKEAKKKIIVMKKCVMH